MNQDMIKLGMLVMLLQMPGIAMGLSSDREQPIHIEADKVEIDDEQGVSTYQGNVHYTQGSIRMTADTVIVHSRRGMLERFIATGTPVHYKQRLDEQRVEVNAEADEMEYLDESERILMRGNARLWRGENEFSGNYIEYNALKDIVSAHKKEGGEERVKVIIQPRTKSADDSDRLHP